MKEVVINETDIVSAANEGMDSFLSLFVKSIKDSIGGELTAETMPMLNVNQITLLASISFMRKLWMADSFS